MVQFTCESSQVSCEASSLVRKLAPPRSVKAALNDLVKLLGWDFSRTREIWYGRARLDPHEMDALRDAAREIDRTATRLLALRDAIAARDPLFHCDDIRALERALRDMGRNVRPASISQDQADGDDAV